ncbi:uncharacterized protein G2W53_036590 [Senna tora]|uniref:Uncharacterized protein n=1 Tax=Senna tora TaxID=362788 RepID=A0A834SU97_9FABA|nr:uncharacterized protein G2W53_036590 [Senna tora]
MAFQNSSKKRYLRLLYFGEISEWAPKPNLPFMGVTLSEEHSHTCGPLP